MLEFNYFPSSFYREELPSWVLETLNKTMPYYEEARTKINDTGFLVLQTEDMAEDESLKYLVNYVKDKSLMIAEKQGYYVANAEAKVNGFWGQEFKANASNIMHVHPNSFICGLYFLNSPENGAFPIFYDPRSGKNMVELPSIPSEYVTEASSTVSFNNMKAGTLMLFNSWVPHSIVSGPSNQSTKFIHFVIKILN